MDMNESFTMHDRFQETLIHAAEKSKALTLKEEIIRKECDDNDFSERKTERIVKEQMPELNQEFYFQITYNPYLGMLYKNGRPFMVYGNEIDQSIENVMFEESFLTFLLKENKNPQHLWTKTYLGDASIAKFSGNFTTNILDGVVPDFLKNEQNKWDFVLQVATGKSPLDNHIKNLKNEEAFIQVNGNLVIDNSDLARHIRHTTADELWTKKDKLTASKPAIYNKKLLDIQYLIEKKLKIEDFKNDPINTLVEQEILKEIAAIQGEACATSFDDKTSTLHQIKENQKEVLKEIENILLENDAYILDFAASLTPSAKSSTLTEEEKSRREALIAALIKVQKGLVTVIYQYATGVTSEKLFLEEVQLRVAQLIEIKEHINKKSSGHFYFSERNTTRRLEKKRVSENSENGRNGEKSEKREDYSIEDYPTTIYSKSEVLEKSGEAHDTRRKLSGRIAANEKKKAHTLLPFPSIEHCDNSYLVESIPEKPHHVFQETKNINIDIDVLAGTLGMPIFTGTEHAALPLPSDKLSFKERKALIKKMKTLIPLKRFQEEIDAIPPFIKMKNGFSHFKERGESEEDYRLRTAAFEDGLLNKRNVENKTGILNQIMILHHYIFKRFLGINFTGVYEDHLDEVLKNTIYAEVKEIEKEYKDLLAPLLRFFEATAFIEAPKIKYKERGKDGGREVYDIPQKITLFLYDTDLNYLSETEEDRYKRTDETVKGAVAAANTKKGLIGKVSGYIELPLQTLPQMLEKHKKTKRNMEKYFSSKTWDYSANGHLDWQKFLAEQGIADEKTLDEKTLYQIKTAFENQMKAKEKNSIRNLFMEENQYKILGSGYTFLNADPAYVSLDGLFLFSDENLLPFVHHLAIPALFTTNIALGLSILQDMYLKATYHHQLKPRIYIHDKIQEAYPELFVNSHFEFIEMPDNYLENWNAMILKIYESQEEDQKEENIDPVRYDKIPYSFIKTINSQFRKTLSPVASFMFLYRYEAQMKAALKQHLEEDLSETDFFQRSVEIEPILKHYRHFFKETDHEKQLQKIWNGQKIVESSLWNYLQSKEKNLEILCIEASTGIGKTHVLKETLVNHDHFENGITLAFPTKNLCQEVYEALDSKTKEHVLLFHGRTEDPTSPGHCHFFEKLQSFAERGQVENNFCHLECACRHKKSLEDGREENNIKAYERAIIFLKENNLKEEDVIKSVPSCAYLEQVEEARKTKNIICTHAGLGHNTLSYFDEKKKVHLKEFGGNILSASNMRTPIIDETPTIGTVVHITSDMINDCIRFIEKRFSLEDAEDALVALRKLSNLMINAETRNGHIHSGTRLGQFLKKISEIYIKEKPLKDCLKNAFKNSGKFSINRQSKDIKDEREFDIPYNIFNFIEEAVDSGCVILNKKQITIIKRNNWLHVDCLKSEKIVFINATTPFWLKTWVNNKIVRVTIPQNIRLHMISDKYYGQGTDLEDWKQIIDWVRLENQEGKSTALLMNKKPLEACLAEGILLESPLTKKAGGSGKKKNTKTEIFPYGYYHLHHKGINDFVNHHLVCAGGIAMPMDGIIEQYLKEKFTYHCFYKARVDKIHEMLITKNQSAWKGVLAKTKDIIKKENQNNTVSINENVDNTGASNAEVANAGNNESMPRNIPNTSGIAWVLFPYEHMRSIEEGMNYARLEAKGTVFANYDSIYKISIEKNYKFYSEWLFKLLEKNPEELKRMRQKALAKLGLKDHLYFMHEGKRKILVHYAPPRKTNSETLKNQEKKDLNENKGEETTKNENHENLVYRKPQSLEEIVFLPRKLFELNIQKVRARDSLIDKKLKENFFKTIDFLLKDEEKILDGFMENPYKNTYKTIEIEKLLQSTHKKEREHGKFLAAQLEAEKREWDEKIEMGMPSDSAIFPYSFQIQSVIKAMKSKWSADPLYLQVENFQNIKTPEEAIPAIRFRKGANLIIDARAKERLKEKYDIEIRLPKNFHLYSHHDQVKFLNHDLRCNPYFIKNYTNKEYQSFLSLYLFLMEDNDRSAAEKEVILLNNTPVPANLADALTKTYPLIDTQTDVFHKEGDQYRKSPYPMPHYRDNPTLLLFAKQLFSDEMIQAIGRARGVQCEKTADVYLFGGFPIQGLSEHGIGVYRHYTTKEFFSQQMYKRNIYANLVDVYRRKKPPTRSRLTELERKKQAEKQAKKFTDHPAEPYLEEFSPGVIVHNPFLLENSAPLSIIALTQGVLEKDLKYSYVKYSNICKNYNLPCSNKNVYYEALKLKKLFEIKEIEYELRLLLNDGRDFLFDYDYVFEEDSLVYQHQRQNTQNFIEKEKRFPNRKENFKIKIQSLLETIEPFMYLNPDAKTAAPFEKEDTTETFDESVVDKRGSDQQGVLLPRELPSSGQKSNQSDQGRNFIASENASPGDLESLNRNKENGKIYKPENTSKLNSFTGGEGDYDKTMDALKHPHPYLWRWRIYLKNLLQNPELAQSFILVEDIEKLKKKRTEIKKVFREEH
jgi:hypothetical protein